MDGTGKTRSAAEYLLEAIDAALVGLARLRAQTGVYEYIPAARLTTAITGIILSPTLLPAVPIAQTPTVNRALQALLDSMADMGVLDDHG